MAAKRKVTVDMTKVEVTAEEREKIINKIKKLLSLGDISKNTSQAEATDAVLKAQELMSRYSIPEEDVLLDEVRDEITSVYTGQCNGKHIMAWRLRLAMVVARNFRVKCYTSTNSEVVFRGFRQDAEVAKNVFLYLYKVGDRGGSRAYKAQMAQIDTGKGAYTSFTEGFLLGVTQALEKQCTALMIVTPKQVEEEYEEFSAGFSQRKAHYNQVTNSQAFESGRIAGKDAAESRKIENKSTKKQTTKSKKKGGE